MSVTREQPLEALQVANEVRGRRADLKRRIKTGEADISSILGAPLPTWLSTMRVGELLEAVPRFGPTRTFRLISSVGNLSYVRRLDRLTERQRFDLLALLAAAERQTATKRGYNRSYEKRHG